MHQRPGLLTVYMLRGVIRLRMYIILHNKQTDSSASGVQTLVRP